MLIKEIPESECRDLLANAKVARLGCSFNDQPYIVPIVMAYEPDYVYFFSTFGKKVEWMRANPKVCVQVDSINGQSEWVSVIANGEYQELPSHATPTSATMPVNCWEKDITGG